LIDEGGCEPSDGASTHRNRD